MRRKRPDIDLLFHALGDPSRRAIVDLVSRGPVALSRLAVPLGITLAAVVQHVQVLEQSGIVTTEKEGRVRTCRIEPGGLSAAESWLRDRRAMWDQALDRLADFLAEEEN